MAGRPARPRPVRRPGPGRRPAHPRAAVGLRRRQPGARVPPVRAHGAPLRGRGPRLLHHRRGQERTHLGREPDHEADQAGSVNRSRFTNFEDYRLRLLLRCGGVKWHDRPATRIRRRTAATTPSPRLVAQTHHTAAAVKVGDQGGGVRHTFAYVLSARPSPRASQIFHPSLRSTGNTCTEAGK